MFNVKTGNTIIYMLDTASEPCGETNDLLVIRNVNNKPLKLLTKCNGTIGGFAEVCTRLSKLSDEMFSTFARVQREANEDV